MKSIKKILSQIPKLLAHIVSFPSKLLPSRWIRKMNSDQRRVFNLVVTGTVLVVGTWTISSLLAPDRSDAAWWNDSWLYRQAATISNSSGSDLTEYQIVITVDTASLISAGKMKADCSDIRVTRNNGTLLPHWVETGGNGCNTATTNIWIKATNIPTSNSTVLLYYGNPSARNTENGNLVFEFFDDFSGSTLNTSKWTGDTSHFPVTGGNLEGSNTQYRIQSTQSFSGDYETITRVNSTNTGQNGNGFTPVGFYSSDSNAYGVLYHGNSANWYTKNNGSYIGKGSFTFTQWTRLQVKVVGTAGSVAVTGESSGSVSTTDTNTNGISGEYITLSKRYDTCCTNQTIDVDWDWTIVKKAVTTEPTVILGSEEKSEGPIAYWSMDEGSGGTVNDNTKNGNNGTISGATWQEESMCLKGRCLYFDGTNDQVTFGNLSNIPLAGDLTISFWMKPTNIAKGRQNPLGKAYGGEFNFTLETSGSLSYYHGSAGGDAAPYTSMGSSAIQQNQWTHVVVTRDTATRTIKYYLNGQLDQSQTYSSSYDPTTSTRLLRFGYEYAGFFQGYLDEVKLYASTYSTEQIRTDFNSGAAAVLGAKDANLNNGLVGYWKMDDNVSGNSQTITDISGNGNNGTTSYGGNTTGMDCTASGKFGTGCSFDGTDDRVDVPANTPMNFATNGTFTIATWIKPNNVSSAWRRGISGSENYLNSGYRFGIENGGKPIFWTTQGGGNLTLTSSENVTLNEWNHVVVTYNNQNVSMYLNGKLTGTVTGGTFIGGSHGTQIGGFDFGTEKFSGVMDEYRTYNRALSPTEVSQLYKYAPPPIYYAPLEEGSGTTVNDLSGNGYTGSIIGSTPRWVQGRYGGALQFTNASGDRVSANTTSGPLTYLNNHTVGFWVKFTDLNDGTYRMVFNHQPTGSDRSPGIWTHASNGTLRLHWMTNPGNPGFGTLGTNGNSGSSSFETNKWYYVSATKDGSTATAYVNGVKVASGTFAEPMAQGTGIIRFGGGAGMIIDEIRVYNYPRTAAQVVEDMNAGHPIGGSPVGSQVGYWDFNEGTGTVVNDKSSGKNNGTINGASWSNDAKSGKALSFNGSSNNISLGNITAYKTENKTISFWAKPSSAPSAFQGIFYGGSNWYVGVHSSNRIFVSYQNSANAQTTAQSSTGTLIPNEWHYYAVSYAVSGTNVTITFYRDGKLVNTVTNTTGHGTNFASSYFLGGASASNYFAGLLDEVKIYNTALTPEEIKVDYNSGQSLQFGALGTESDGKTPSNSVDRMYCPPGDTTATCGPIAEWLFEEGTGTTAQDTSVNSNNGTLTNGPTWTRGRIGNAIRFDGTNDYVDTGTTGQSLSTITLSAWININNYTTNYRSGIISRRNGSGLNFGVSGDIEGAGNLSLYEGGAVLLKGTTTLQKNQWYYVTAVLNGTSVKLYVNGKEDASGTGSWTWTSGNPITIGSIAGISGYYFNGIIDHAQIYNYALSPSQIVWNYNRGAPVAYYDFDECQGNIIHSLTKPYNPALDGTITIGGTGTQTSAGTCQTSGTAWGNGVSGKINGSLNFDGTDDYVEIPQPNIQTSPNLFTITGWIKPTDHQSYFITPNSTGIDQFIIYNGVNQRIGVMTAEAVDTNQNSLYSPIGSVQHNKWTHFAISINDRTVKIYINGILSAETTRGNNISGWAGNWRIGQRGNSSFWYQGQMDDLQIFNYELTPQQVRTVMNQGAIKFGP